jgi:colanic acid biosynthesis glycosyl transferase WcaI
MKVFVYGINYAPELSGIGKYTGELAEWLAEQTHQVEVFTGKPYYPEWQVHPSYKKKWWYTECVNKVKIHRSPLYVPKQLNSLKRIWHEFSFIICLIPFWFVSLFQKKADIVIVIAPPFHLGLLALCYAKLKRTKILYHVQDLQVDAAKDMAMIKNTWALRLMFKLEAFIMKHVDYVSTISDGMVNKIKAKGISTSTIFLFPNWVDTHFMTPKNVDDSMRKELQISMNDFVVMYSGNLGEKQGLENMLYVAEKFQSEKQVLFLVVGSGGNKEKLMQQASQSNLTNVRFIDLQAHEKFPSLLAVADVHLVLQKASASDLMMPSKLTGILSVGGYSIVTALEHTSLHGVIHYNQVGDVILPDDLEALYNAIAKAIHKDLKPYKLNARTYALNHLEKTKLLSEFERAILKIVN